MLNWAFFLEILRTVAESLRNYKLRAALTLIGVIIGTGVVTTVSAIFKGVSTKVAEITERSAPNVVYFTKEDKIGPSFGQPSQEERLRRDLTLEDAEAVAELSTPVGVSPQKIRGEYGPTPDPPQMAANGKEAINPLILGVWENFPELLTVPIRSGRFFTKSERQRREQVVVIGSGVARQLFPGLDPLGREVRLDGRLYRVIGVLDDAPGDGILGSDDLNERTVYAPFETVQRNYPEIKDMLIVVRAPAGATDRVTADVTEVLRRRRNVPFDAPNNFGVNRAEQIFDVVNRIIAGISAVTLPITLTSLLVGGIGVMNVMLVAVRERGPEIGVRRAVGATQRQILAQFLTEAVALTGVGGVIGILAGLCVAFLMRFGFGFPAVVPIWSIFAGAGGSMLIGLVAGAIPAWRAAHLDPVSAMRGD